MNKKGKLVVIDGTDGSGKTTQIELLKKNLDSQGVSWEAISFPQYGKNEYVLEIEKYLEGKMGAIDTVDPYFIAHLYAGDRKTARDLIKGWLEEGKLVIANRYISSSKAHLGANIPSEKREDFFKWLDSLEYGENGMPKEDLTILLVVDPDVGQKNVRDKHRPDIHEDNLKHLIEANKIYLELATKYHWIILNCMENGVMRSREAIQKDLLNKITVLLSPS